MNILYDHQVFESQNVGGVSRYHVELWKALNRFDDVNANISVKYSDNIYLKDENFPIKPKFDDYNKFILKREFPSKRRFYKFASSFIDLSCSQNKNKEHTFLQLLNNKTDIFHPTFYDPYFLDYINKTPFVITVHDMIQENHPEYSKNDYTFLNKKIVINKASRIIAISEYTKEQIIKYYNINDQQIDVIHHGFNMFDADKIDSSQHTEPYILFVGTRGGYKNFYFILHGLRKILNAFNLNLICIGPPPTKYEMKYLEFVELNKRVRFISNIDDKQLFTLYKNAKVFIFPSLEEGFGLPILEAMNAKCPILLSNIPIFKEIAGDASLYFNPYDVYDFTEKLKYVLEANHTSKNELINKGIERLKKYTWHNTAEKTANCYKRI